MQHAHASLTSLLACLALSAALAGQEAKGKQSPAEELLLPAVRTAFVDVTVYTVDDKTGKAQRLDGVTVLVDGGKFGEIGKDVDVPRGYEVVRGGVLVPGLVYLGSDVGMPRASQPGIQLPPGVRLPPGFHMPRRGNRQAKPVFSPTVKVADRFQYDDQRFAAYLKSGVTTHGINAPGTGLPGLSAVVKAAGPDRKSMVVEDESLLSMSVRPSSAAKKVLSDNFAKARELLKQRAEAKKPKPTPAPAARPEPAKPVEAKGPGPEDKKDPAPKPEPKPEPKPQPKPEPKPEPKPQPTPQPKPEPRPGQDPASKPAEGKPATQAQPQQNKEDPNIAKLAEVLEGKQKVLFEVGDATDLLHGLDALGDEKFSFVLMQEFDRGEDNSVDRLIDALKERKVDTVVLSAEIAYRPGTRYYWCPQRRFLDAGFEVALTPGENGQSADQLWYRAGELVRAGIPREQIVRSLTWVPAKALGAQKRVGSIAKGKDADFLHFSRDPFSPAARLLRVWFEGRPVERPELLGEPGQDEKETR